MKAVVLNNHGGIEQFEYVDSAELNTEISRETKKTPFAIIKILYSTVNRNDITFRKGYDNLSGNSGKSPFTFPKILGSDGLGIITEIENNSTLENYQFQIGDLVLIPPYFYEKTNNDSLIRYSLGINYQGTYAEYIYFPLNCLINLTKLNIIEDDLKYLSTFPTAGLISIKSILSTSKIEKSKLKKLLIDNQFQELLNLLSNHSNNLTDKKKLMILGANSGVGSFVIELAKLFNYEVVTSVGNPKNKKYIEENIDVNLHYEDNFQEFIRQKYYDQLDTIIDFLGGEFINLYTDLLKQNSSIISIGGLLGKNVNINLQKLYSKNITLKGISIYEDYDNYILTIKLLEFLIYLYKSKKELKPHIFEVKELKEIIEVHKLLENSVYYGKFVLKH